MIDGRVVYAAPSSLWVARGTCLLHSVDGGQSWKHPVSLPLTATEKLKAGSRLARRLLRSGVHHHLMVGQSDVLVCNKNVFVRSGDEPAFVRAEKINGSRPLSIATNDRLICYGEYHSNSQRKPMRVFGSRDGGYSWAPIWEFNGVRHVHGVHFDSCTGQFWVTTGDSDSESAIWTTADEFQTLRMVLGGSQATRAVELLFTEEWVYYGSDSPQTQNFLYRMERKSGQVEVLQSVGSSVFFGCKVGGHLFFSTAAEPSEVNRSDRAELWHSTDGENWRLLRTFSKDLLSARYFQYGQILFPAGPGDGKNLYFTPFATNFDQFTERLSLDQLERRPEY